MAPYVLEGNFVLSVLIKKYCLHIARPGISRLGIANRKYVRMPQIMLENALFRLLMCPATK